MSDYSMYHALGVGEPSNDPSRRTQPAPPQFQTPAIPPPAGYRQTGSSYSSYPPGQQPYGGTPQPGHATQGNQNQEQSYFPRQDAPHTGGQTNGSMGGLVSQMGSMRIAGEVGGTARSHRKRDRHAYHNLETPGGSSQAFNGMPQGGFGSPSQFLDGDSSQQQLSSHPYAGQSITPAMSQFPASPNVPFSPGGQPSRPEHGARPNFGAPNPPITPGNAPGSAQGRVDPEQIPSVPRSRDGPAQYYLDHVYPTMEQHLPPPAAIPFVAHDQGNSSPKFARLTLNNIPSTSEALGSTGLPLGLILQPLASLQVGETPIPVLDFGETGPPRCRRCRAYINPFMTFRAGGNKLVCNMCTHPNEVAPEYFAPTDPSGVRVDRGQRPELMMGTVEFMVPKEYWAKEPTGLQWLFLIDVGQEAVNRGFLEVVCEGILGALYGENPSRAASEQEDDVLRRNLPPGSKVGFVTFDKEVHFYNTSVRELMSKYLARELLTHHRPT